MMRTILIISLWVLAVTATAQSRVFVGRITDRQHRGIPFAIVQVKDRPQGVYTDENGAFAFTADAAEVQTLVFFCMGYEKKEMAVAGLPADSIMVTLNSQATALREVAITGRKGKARTATLGNSRRQLHHDGECYRNYGAETAIKLKADTAHDGVLKEVYVYITGDGDWRTRFRVHVYEWDLLPGRELTDSNIIVAATRPDSWVRVDLTALRIPVNDGLFVSVEWISGYGNTQQVLGSAKHPEVTAYNGQVPGLTTGYGKPSRTYSRKPFASEWEWYDDAAAPRKGGYFLNPMIYATYSYVP
jgi:hypothetical protein